MITRFVAFEINSIFKLTDMWRVDFYVPDLVHFCPAQGQLQVGCAGPLQAVTAA